MMVVVLTESGASHLEKKNLAAVYPYSLARVIPTLSATAFVYPMGSSSTGPR